MLSGLRLPQALGFAVVMRNQERVFVLEAVEVLQDGRSVVVKAVVAPPLQIADLDRDLGQFVGVGVDLDGAELMDAEKEARLANGDPGGFGVGSP
jgi:hypothetical protein